MMEFKIAESDVSIVDGIIKIDGQEVGTVNHDHKHGYHPAVLLEIQGRKEWFELDTKDLINAIANKAVELYKETK
jgi:hypothetical protein